jgi:hypothetical protein
LQDKHSLEHQGTNHFIIYLVIRLRSKKLGDPALRGIDGDLEADLDRRDRVECDAELEWLTLRLDDRLETDERDLELLELDEEDDLESDRDREL